MNDKGQYVMNPSVKFVKAHLKISPGLEHEMGNRQSGPLRHNGEDADVHSAGLGKASEGLNMRCALRP